MEILKMKTFFKRRKNNGNFKRGIKFLKKEKIRRFIFPLNLLWIRWSRLPFQVLSNRLHSFRF